MWGLKTCSLFSPSKTVFYVTEVHGMSLMICKLGPEPLAARKLSSLEKSFT